MRSIEDTGATLPAPEGARTLAPVPATHRRLRVLLVGGDADARSDLRAQGHDVTVVTTWEGPRESVCHGVIRLPAGGGVFDRVRVVAWIAANAHRFDVVVPVEMVTQAMLGGWLGNVPVRVHPAAAFRGVRE
jgi:hypothetical protein